MLGMMVVSRAVYALETQLSWTVAATIIRDEHFVAVFVSKPVVGVVSGVGSSHRATELTLSLSTRVGFVVPIIGHATNPTSYELHVRSITLLLDRCSSVICCCCMRTFTAL